MSIEIAIQLKSNYSSGDTDLKMTFDYEKEDDLYYPCILGKYKDKQIQIDFEGIKIQDLADVLKACVSINGEPKDNLPQPPMPEILPEGFRLAINPETGSTIYAKPSDTGEMPEGYRWF